MTLEEMRTARTRAVEAAQAIDAKARADGREPTDAEALEVEAQLQEAKQQDDALNAEEKKLEAADRDRRLKDAVASLAVPNPRRTTSGAPGRVRERVWDDPNRGFRSMGEFGAAVMSAAGPARDVDERLRIMCAAYGMNQSIGSEGGFAVPPAFATQIWDGLNTGTDNLLPRTDNYTVTGESLTFQCNAETSRATGSRYGGIRGYWLAEAAQITKSTPTLRQVRIEPKQLGVLVYMTDKLMKNNVVALDQYLVRAATDEINFLVGNAILNGTGAGQPLGIVGHAGTMSVSKEAGQAAATICIENIDKMWSALHSRSRTNAVWLINQDVEPQLDQLALSVGTGGSPVYMPPGGLSEIPYSRLKGRPVLPIEFCATIGTVGDIILADLKGYITGTRGGIESALSMHIRFDYAETAFRFLFDVDGQPWLQDKITPFSGSTNYLSTFVTLATRA